MTRIGIVIATTLGPVEVVKITPEHPDVNSVACVMGSDLELPISAGYNGFVRSPTGIIQKYYEHPAYLLEVSGPIDVGDSWKLGVFAAHALHYADRLAGGIGEADRVVWTTGEVWRDLSVPPVGYVEEKLRQSESLFLELSRLGTPVTLFVPKGNIEGIDENHLRDVGVPAGSIVPVADGNDVLRELDLPVLDVAKRSRPAARASDGGRRRWIAALGAGLLAAGSVGGIAWDRWTDRPPEATETVRATSRLTRLMSAMDIEGSSTVNGRPFVMKLRQNGAATVEIQSTDPDRWFRDRGRWWVHNGRFCFEFERFAGGTARCPVLHIQNGRIEASRMNGINLPWTFRPVTATTNP